MQPQTWTQAPTIWYKVSSSPNKGARRSTHVLVASTLQGKVVGGGRGLEADIELGQGDLDTELGEAADGVDVLVESGEALGDQVGLQADAIDPNAFLAQGLDNVLGRHSLGAGGLQVVVIVVQLGLGVDLGGGLEGQLDVVRAEGVVEDGLAVGAVVVQGLVDDVPGVALALPVAHDVGDVVDDDGLELLGGPRGCLDPRGELAVPDEGVAAQVLAVLARQRRDDLALGVVEAAAGGLDEGPL